MSGHAHENARKKSVTKPRKNLQDKPSLPTIERSTSSQDKPSLRGYLAALVRAIFSTSTTERPPLMRVVFRFILAAAFILIVLPYVLHLKHVDFSFSFGFSGSDNNLVARFWRTLQQWQIQKESEKILANPQEYVNTVAQQMCEKLRRFSGRSAATSQILPGENQPNQANKFTLQNQDSILKSPQTAQVIKVVDGDTIKVRIISQPETLSKPDPASQEAAYTQSKSSPQANSAPKANSPPEGRIYTVRYIGIDTPELKDKTKYAQIALELNKKLVAGKTVQLYKDVRNTDRYGRLLRYVCVDGRLVNAIILGYGYANVLTIPPDVFLAPEFAKLQHFARQNHLGLWQK